MSSQSGYLCLFIAQNPFKCHYQHTMNGNSKNWKKAKLSDLCRVVSGGTPSTSDPRYWNGEIPWITPMDLSKHKTNYIKKGSRNISDLGLKNSTAELVPPKSLIMSSRAPIGYLVINAVQATTNQGCKSFVCGEKIDVEYLYYYLSYHMDDVKRLGSGSTFAEVGKKQLESLEVTYPESLGEQRKIVEILSNTDCSIEKTDQIIQKSEELKNGLMSELLTKGIGHTKFKKTKIGEIPEEWNISPLSDISHRITDGKHGDCKNENESGYFFISSKDIRNNSINYDQARQITEVDFEDADKRTRLEAGDLVMTNSGTIGRMAIASEDPRTRKTTFQKSVAIIKPKLNIVTSQFLIYYFQSAIVSLTVSSNGSAQKNLLLKDMRSFFVPVPSMKEQDKIVQILETIDNKIENESKTKEKLVAEKNGIMQNIFCHKVQIN